MKEQISLRVSVSRAMSSEDENNIANGISVAAVRDCMSRTEPPLILDCRQFIAFNTKHISGAVNVYCPPILKRRSNGFVALENIVTCETKRKQLLEGRFSSVIAYDEDTYDLAMSTKDSNLYSVLKSLRQQVDVERFEFIVGGFRAFEDENSDLCSRQTKTHTGLTLAPPPKYRSNSKTGPVEILPGLYLGDSQHSAQESNLRELGITALLNVSTNCKNFFERDFCYMNIPINDNDTANISSWFNEAIQFIDNTRDNDGKVLVHCQAGVSRSATVCIAYLMFKNNMTLEKAFDCVRAKRGVISPNLNFMQQLLEFEKDVCVTKETSDIQDSVSSISTSLASVEFDYSCSSTSASDFSSSSGTFEFSFATPSQVPPVSPRELVSPS